MRFFLIAVSCQMAALVASASLPIDMTLWRGETNVRILHDYATVGPPPAGFEVKVGTACEVRYLESQFGTHYSSFADRVVWDSSELGVRVLSVTVGLDVKPGVYRCGDLRLTVQDRILPPSSEWKYYLDLWQHPWAVARWNKVTPFSAEHYEAMRPLWTLLATAGQKALTVTIVDRPWNQQCYDAYRSMIRRIKADDGSWRFDYSLFDEYVAFGRKCGIGPKIACYTMCPWDYEVFWENERGEEVSAKAEPGSETFADYWGAFLVDFSAHLKEKGWFKDAYIALDERGPDDVAKIVAFLHEKAPRLAISFAGRESPADFAAKGVEIENCCVGLRHLKSGLSADAAVRRAKGMTTTYYVCCSPRWPNTFAASDLHEAFWLGAYPAFAGLDGFLRWAWNSWGRDPIRDASYTGIKSGWMPGDTYLVYPDGSPSLRFLELRNGIIAAEKVRILRESGAAPATEFATLARRYDREGALKNEVDFKAIKTATEAFVNGARESVSESGFRIDAEGFVWTDGKANVLSDGSRGDNYIIRFELASTNAPAHAWLYRLPQRWDFVELRQVDGVVTEVRDGIWKTRKGFHPGRNWRKWVDYAARNVRVKFVSSGYDPATDGVEMPPIGFVSLFNGKDLTGWRGLVREGGFERPHVRRAMLPEKRWEYEAKGEKAMKEHWSVKDGTLFFDGLPGGYNIAAEKQYGNFEAQVDWRLLRVGGDSGFYLRGLPQVQVWDPALWDGLGSGCIWNNSTESFSALACADHPIGDWNRCRMKIVGDRVWVWLNDVQTVDGAIYQNRHQPGLPIPLVDNFELQCHGDPVEFRNLFIRELPDADVPDMGKAVRGKPIDLLANGLEDWEATDSHLKMGWSVKDGVLVNHVTDNPEKMLRGGSGGTHLRTKRSDFFDFDLSYDVYVGKMCNSGVYLRGRYEIQANDSYGRKRDSHVMASLYDLIGPSVAAEKPAGEWQHVDLTLYRRHLTVTLNGVRIIDNKPIPGVTPCALDGNEFVPGPILLQGDHSNVSFRNMVLTPIVR